MNSELNLKFFLNAVKKYIIYILVITVLCAGIAAVYTFTRVPVYSVSATFYSVNVPSATDPDKDYSYTSSGLVSAQQQLVNDYIEIIKSDKMLTVARDALKDMGYGNMSVARIRSMISASQIDETSAFTVTISGTDTKEISDIITVICEKVTPIIDDTQQREHSIKVLSDPKEISARKISPNESIHIISGFAIGLFGSLFIFLIVAYYDRTVRSEEDLKKRFDLPIIGVIPTWEK